MRVFERLNAKVEGLRQNDRLRVAGFKSEHGLSERAEKAQVLRKELISLIKSEISPFLAELAGINWHFLGGVPSHIGGWIGELDRLLLVPEQLQEGCSRVASLSFADILDGRIERVTLSQILTLLNVGDVLGRMKFLKGQIEQGIEEYVDCVGAPSSTVSRVEHGERGTGQVSDRYDPRLS